MDSSSSDPHEPPADTVGSLLADIATSLQDALRILIFADKRGWGPDEFEQIRAVEEALDEAKHDFQGMGPLVNGQFYYENDTRAESLQELRSLRRIFEAHTQIFRDWIRSGGPISPLWVHDTVALRRKLHRAQCRAARRIFNAEHEAGDGSGSGARCLGAYLVYRRYRQLEDARKQYFESKRQRDSQGYDVEHAAADSQRGSGDAAAWPSWRQQLPHIYGREPRRLMSQEPFRGRNGYSRTHSDETVVLEMTPQNGQITSGSPGMQGAQGAQSSHTHSSQSSNAQVSHAHRPPPLKSALKASQKMPATPTVMPISPTTIQTARTTIPLSPNQPPSPPPRPPSLEDLVPDCNAIGTFERFGDHDIAFICDYCDGHVVWEDIQRLPTTRVPPAAVSSADMARSSSGLSGPPVVSSGSGPDPSSSSASYLPFVVPRHGGGSSMPPTPLPFRRPSPHLAQPSTASSASVPDGDDGDDGYPRWQASTVAMSDASKARTIVFAPLAIANHLPPMAGGWEARLWCPYCDDYVYFDSAEGDQTKYAQDEYGFASLAEFQDHLEWHHSALPMPALPAKPSSCAVM